MGNRNNFFHDAGFDEGNQGNQQMPNNNMFGGMQQAPMNNPNMMNQGMMNNQPMQNDGMFGGMQQPSIDNSNMMNQGMMNNQSMQNDGMFGGMQQPMMNQPMQNDGMFGGMQQPMMNQQMPNNNMFGGMQQPMMNQMSNNGNKKMLPINLNDGIGRIIIPVGVLVVALILIIVFCHKTLSCTQEIENGEFTMEMTAKVEYWFGKATSRTAIMTVNYEDLDGESKDQIVEYLEELGEIYQDEDDSVKYSIKDNDKSVVLKIKNKVKNDDDADSYDEEREYLIDSDYVCK